MPLYSPFLSPSKEIFLGLCALVCALVRQVGHYHPMPFKKFRSHIF
jgi:hypothetical protein